MREAASSRPGRRLRVLILNQPFHPDVVATAQIAKDLADDLVAMGHHVTAISSRSIYGRRGATLPKRETVDGIEIIRVGSNLFGKGSTVGRLLDFASYYFQAAFRGLTMVRFDAVVCLTTPPYIALAGLLQKALRDTRVVYWLMDVYPDVMVAHDMLAERSVLHRVLARLHLSVLRRVDATVVLGRCMKRRLVDQGADPSRIDVVPVWSVSDDATPAPPRSDNAFRRRWGVGDRVLVMYAGNFGLAHDVDTFLRAAEALRDDDRLRFAFVGGGKRKAEVDAFVRDRSLTNCVLDEYQPREALGELLAAADAHLVTMLPRWWGLVVPSKFYGVAGAGRAAVFVGPGESEIAQSIDEWGCGVHVEPGDVKGLIDALSRLADDPAGLREMGRRGASAARAHASRGVCTGRLAALIEDDAKAPDGPGVASDVMPRVATVGQGRGH